MANPLDGQNSIASAAKSALLPHHRAHLAKSGLTDATLASAGVASVTDGDQARVILNWSAGATPPPVPAIVFPFWGLEPYARLRPDTPRIKDGKPVKYEAPVNRPSRLYVPLSICPAIQDPSAELILTEGEKKALAACQAGVPTVAASGVYQFHDVAARNAAKTAGKDEWTPSAELVPLIVGRPVTIAFDSDIDSNPTIVRAAAVLARMAYNKASEVNITFLTSDGGQKVGLDDLYVASDRNADVFRNLLAAARRPTRPDALLCWLADRWGSWAAPQQHTELRRAVCFCELFLNPDEFTHWTTAATKALKVPSSVLTSCSLKSIHLNGQATTGWYSAPGYAVKAGGSDHGVWRTNAGSRPPDRIAAAPINISEIGTDEDGAHHVTVRWAYGSDENCVTLPRLHVVGPELLGLASRGAPVTQANRGTLQDFLLLQEQTNLAVLPRIEALTRFGWSQDLRSFVVGRTVIGGNRRAIADADERFLEALQPRGDVARYLKLCREVLNASPGAEAAWASGYASPLLRPLGLRSLLISIWGPSHGGKSAAQALAVSPWGQPEGLKLTGDATPTAVEANLARCRDLVAWIDDTQQTRSRAVLDTLAYQVGGGTGRARGTVTGGLRRIANWLCVGFVSGEHPLLKVSAAVGARNRTLEFRAVLMPRELAAHVHQELSRHHGFTGPHFIEALVKHFVAPGKLSELSAWLDYFTSSLAPTTPSQSARYVSLLMLADFLARMLVLGEDQQTALDAALAMGSALLGIVRQQRDSSVDRIQAAYETIVAWVAEHNGYFTGDAPKRYGIFVDVKEHGGKRAVAALPEPLRTALEDAGFDLEEVLHGLLERDLLIPGETDRLGRRISIAGERPRAYCIVLPEAPDDGGDVPPSPGPGGGAPGPNNPQGVQAVPNGCPAVPAVPAPSALIYTETMPTAEEALAPESLHTEEYRDTGIDPDPEEEEEGKDCGFQAATAVPVDVPAGQLTGQPSLTPQPLPPIIVDSLSAEQACLFLSKQSALYLAAAPFAPPSKKKARKKKTKKGPPHPAAPPVFRLVSVASPDGQAVIFDIGRLGGMPPCLAQLLGSLPVVGYDLTSIAPTLRRQFQLTLAKPVDLKTAWILADGYVGLAQEARTLAAAVAHHLGEQLPAETGAVDWTAPALSHEQLRLSARSTTVLLPLHARLLEKVAAGGVQHAWEIENGVITPLAVATVVGMGVDVPAIEAMVSNHRAKAEQELLILRPALGDINMRSDKEVREVVSSRFHIDLVAFDENSLMCLSSQVPALANLVAYRRAATRASVAQSWLDAAGPDGRVHPTFHPLAAVSGRMSCSGPALQQVPRAPEVRSCFVPAPGNKLIVADFKMSQLRIAADITRDEVMLQCLCAKPPIDLHRKTASAFTGQPESTLTEEQRRKAKVFNFGLLLGMTPAGLVHHAKEEYGLTITLEEAQAAHSSFFGLYKGLAAWHAEAQMQAPKLRYSRSRSGRLRRLITSDPRELVHQYLCTQVQGTEADALKLAITLMYPHLAAIGAYLVNANHDECIVEAPAAVADKALAIVEWAMKTAMGSFLKLVPVEVDSHVADAWLKP